jgi:hypothetical protein
MKDRGIDLTAPLVILDVTANRKARCDSKNDQNQGLTI